MVRTKVELLLTASEVFNLLWNKIKGEREENKIDDLKIILSKWADSNESGTSGIRFNGYIITRKQSKIICFLSAEGFCSGREEKPCGSVIYGIKTHCKNETELLGYIKEKISNNGRKFLYEAFEVIKLRSLDERINLESLAGIQKFTTLKDGKTLYKKEIIEYLFGMTKLFLSPAKKNKRTSRRNTNTYRTRQSRLEPPQKTQKRFDYHRSAFFFICDLFLTSTLYIV
ncbi:MAG: hypothetical protein WCO84_03065 [bacterium]